MDDYGTQIIILNEKARSLDFYAVQWDFDMSAIDPREYEKLDDAIIAEDEQRYQAAVK